MFTVEPAFYRAGAPYTRLLTRSLHVPILSHAYELYSFAKYRKSPFERLRASSPAQAVISALLFILRGLRNIVWDVLLSPSTFILNPFQSLSIVFFYPLFGSAIFLLSFAFALARVGGFGQSVLDYVGDKWAKGYSIINWPDPELFDKLASSVVQSRSYLGGATPTTSHQDWPPNPNAPFRERAVVRAFPLPLARAMLGMCALVYERKDSLVVQAKEVATTTFEAFGDSSDAFYQELQSAAEMLVLSEGAIRDQAEKWGLAFEGVSDLNSVGGSFAGLFYSPLGVTQPFVVLTFKGTGPTAFAGWLTDCTLDRTPATSVLGGGGAHTGFYEALFKAPRRDYESNGYDNIVRALQQVAEALRKAAVEMGGDQGVKVQLWVTGHSLGGAYAELAHMRFLASPGDLGNNIELRDCITFGTPRCADGQLSGLFDKFALTPLDRPSTLWRVKNRLDHVTRVPLGITDEEAARDALSPLSVLNYAHLGPAIRLHKPAQGTGEGRFSIEYLGRFRGSAHVQILEHDGSSVPWQAGGVPSISARPALKIPPPTPAASRFGILGRIASMLWGLFEATDSSLYGFVKARDADPVKWGITALAALVPWLWNHFPASYLDSLGLPPPAYRGKGERDAMGNAT